MRRNQPSHGTNSQRDNQKVVHHCNVFLKAPGSRNDIDAQGELGSYCLAATTPGWLRPGGWLLAVTPALRNSSSVQETNSKQTMRRRKGLRITNPPKQPPRGRRA